MFSTACAGCHGLDGRGGEHAPNIATVSRIQNLADADLQRIVHSGIPQSGMPGFGKRFTADQITAVVFYLRTLQGKQSATAIPGNAENGRSIFFGKGGCAECHSIEGKGGFLAADLTGYGNTHSVDDARQAIIDPYRNLDPQKQVITITTGDGRTFSGIARNEDNFSVQLQTPDGAFHLFDKAKLVRLNREPRSLMPPDYGTKLTSNELNDLLRYLATLRPQERSKKAR